MLCPPLTDDTHTIELLLSVLDPAVMPLAGNAPILALQAATKLATQAQVEQARILLITDGIPAADFDALGELVGSSRFELSILGIGTQTGAPIPLPSGGFCQQPAQRSRRRQAQSL